MNRIVVGKYGKGQCETIAEAFDIAMGMKGHVDIHILNGIYNEKLELSRDNVTITGESAEHTVITYNDYAKKMHEDGKMYGTFRTATLKLCGENIIVKDITIKNHSGNGRDFGQAVALYADGDKMQFYRCRMIGCQDTLFTAPTTECKVNCEEEQSPELHTINARQYYKDCYIEGDIDFIFGGAAAYFDHCEIFSRYNITEDDDKYEGSVKGYVAAACTWRDNRYGYVFYKCNFTGDCPEGSVYLGRPWRIYAKTVLLGCTIGKHIKVEGFSDWDKPKAHDTAFYAEYRCKYETHAKRHSWIKQLTPSEAKAFTKEKVLWEYFCED